MIPENLIKKLKDEYGLTSADIMSLSSIKNIGAHIHGIIEATKFHNSIVGNISTIIKESKMNNTYKSIKKLDLSGNIIDEYSSITEASKDNGIDYKTVSRSIKSGKTLRDKKFKFIKT